MLSEVFRVSPQTLTKWTKQGMPIKEQRSNGQANVYDTRACIDWYVSYKAGTHHDLTAERARLAHHQANKTALEENVLKGQLVPADQIENEWVTRTLKLRAALLAMPTKLASVALAASSMAEVREWCTQEINQALNALSDDTRTAADNINPVAEGSASVKAAAESKGKRVGRAKAPAKRGSKRRAGPVAQ